MSISNRTVYDKKRLIRLNDFAVFKRFLWLPILILSILVLAMVAFLLIRDPRNPKHFLYLGFIIFLDLLYVFFYFILPRLTVNKSILLNTELLFEFQEDAFKVTANAKNMAGETRTEYSAILKVLEFEQDIYLFISSSACHVIDKSGFIEGNADELIELLKSKNIPCKK